MGHLKARSIALEPKRFETQYPGRIFVMTRRWRMARGAKLWGPQTATHQKNFKDLNVVVDPQ